MTLLSKAKEKGMVRMQTKANNNKLMVDILTIILLLAAFTVAFVMGFVNTNAETGEYVLAAPIVALVSVGGLGILYFSGSVAELVSRIKRDQVNIGFIVLFALSTIVYAALITMMLAVLCKMTSVADFLPRFVYIAAVLVIIGSYYGSVVYASKIEAEKEKAQAAE